MNDYKGVTYVDTVITLECGDTRTYWEIFDAGMDAATADRAMRRRVLDIFIANRRAFSVMLDGKMYLRRDVYGN